MNLLRTTQETIRTALAGMVDDPSPYVAMVKPTQDPKHGDYQANCAMALAKVLGKKPRDIAQEIADRLPKDGPFQTPEIAGPGFINLRFSELWLGQRLAAMAADPRLGVALASPAKTYVVDFSSPNVAKPMHVGHLRSTIIGDAITRLARHLGHTVVTDNHLGDWGTQFGMLLYGYKNLLDEASLKADPVRELARLYKAVRKMMSDDEAEGQDPVSVQCRLETAKLHAGDEENTRLWKVFMPWCMEELDRIYRRLDISFDHTLGESWYNPVLASVVDELLSKGIAEESRGAVVVFTAENQPPSIVRKKDGAFTYTTTDLATIRHRMQTWKPAAILYVVDARQSFHFQCLFAIARKWGLTDIEFQHVSFGTVLGEDRTPIKTREGEPIELGTLLDEAVVRASEIYEANREEGDVDTLSEEEKKRIHEVVGVGAVKYADLCQNRTSDYIFSWPKMLAMNGNTATYMQYAYARNRSIFRKAGEDSSKFRSSVPAPSLGTPHERALAVQLLRFEESLIAAAAEYQPSGITSYLWDLAKTYSGFFQNCPVLRADTPQVKNDRLLLCDLTARVLQTCLGLLGIKTVERM